MVEQRLDLDKPLWDQSTFLGRWKHFAWVTDFRTCIVSEDELLRAKNLRLKYRSVPIINMHITKLLILSFLF